VLRWLPGCAGAEIGGDLGEIGQRDQTVLIEVAVEPLAGRAHGGQHIEIVGLGNLSVQVAVAAIGVCDDDLVEVPGGCERFAVPVCQAKHRVVDLGERGGMAGDDVGAGGEDGGAAAPIRPLRSHWRTVAMGVVPE